MSAARKELQQALCRYITDTLIYMDTVRGFCKESSNWFLWREKELKMMKHIKDRADGVDLNIDHVTNSKNKGQAFSQYMKSKVTQVTAHSRLAELEKELADVLKDTLGGLEKLKRFLDAVEKLAVTSLHVFVENQVLHLLKEISLEQVQVVITAARLICPQLLEFKRDAEVFFVPSLQNVEVHSFQLEKYIETTKNICHIIGKSHLSEFGLEMTAESVVDLDVDLSEDDIQRMLDHINQLSEIRMNQSFRLVFLFQDEPCSGFISEFIKRKTRMLQFLQELEENAVQLDKMNKGAKISSVAGSSVAVVGSVLSIVGLALVPVTAGVSLALTMTGVGLGITSGVNSIATTATEIRVNRKYQGKANEVFKSFMEDVQIVQDCLEHVINIQRNKTALGLVSRVGKVLSKFATVGNRINSLACAGMVVVKDGKAVGKVPKVASDIPDIGQAAVKGPLALSKSARAGLIAVNALFLGMDIYFICKDSIDLAKDIKTKVSQFIRARGKLWRSEIDSWKKIRDSLSEGLLNAEKNKAILEKPFYPDMG